MRTRILYKTLLLASLFFEACVQDDINDDPVANYSNEEKKDVVLIRMGTDDAEVKDITSRLFNNIPASWEIGKKRLLTMIKWQIRRRSLILILRTRISMRRLY